jgi:uncharacterized protein
MNQINSAFTLFLSLLVEAIPFLLLGVLFSGVLQFFVDDRKLLALMPKNPLLGSFMGSCIGFLFPVCECGNVPVARRLLMQGAPIPVAIGFLLAAPTINPIVFWVTWTAFREQPEIVFWRVGLSLTIATVIGVVFSVQSDLRPLLQPSVARMMTARSEIRAKQVEVSLNPLAPSIASLLQPGTYFAGQSHQPLSPTAVALQAEMASLVDQPWGFKLRLLLDSMIQETRELGGVLVLGSAIAAILQVFVPVQ